MEIVRRLIITSCLLLVPSDKSIIRITIAQVTCFCYIVLLLVMKPFRRADDTIVAASANIMLVFVFVIANQVKVYPVLHYPTQSCPILPYPILSCLVL